MSPINLGLGVGVCHGRPSDPFVTQRNKLLFDIYPARQTYLVTPGLRGSVQLVQSSTQYFSIAGNAPNADQFNFPGDGTTSTGSVCWWAKFNNFGTFPTMFCKTDPTAASVTTSNLVWALVTGSGTGKRFDLYANDGSNIRTVSWSLSALSTGVWYCFVLTYNGDPNISGGAAKAKLYVNGALQSTPDSTLMPQKFQNKTAAGNEMSIGGKFYSTSPTFDGELQQVSFHSTVLTQSDVTAYYSSGAGTESVFFNAISINFNLSQFARYDFTETPGATLIDNTNSRLDMTPHSTSGTIARKMKVTGIASNGPISMLLIGGGYPPSTSPTRSRNREPYFNYDAFGPGLHGITVEAGNSLYCVTNAFIGRTTGNYFFAGRWDNSLGTEDYECGIGDDTQGVSPPGNDHSMYFGQLGPSNSGLSGGQYCMSLRPDGTGESPAFGGVVNNLGGTAGNPSGPVVGATYTASGQAHVKEMSLVDLTDASGYTPGGYRFALNGVAQPINVSTGSDIKHRWLADFAPTSLFLASDASGSGNSFTIGRVVMFAPTLTDSERASINITMKSAVGL